MRDTKKKNFIIVTNCNSGQVCIIIEGPSERKLTRESLEQVDALILQKTNELSEKFMLGAFDVFVARASCVDDIKFGFEESEYWGWEDVKIDILSF